jgi:hypothetical protein
MTRPISTIHQSPRFPGAHADFPDGRASGSKNVFTRSSPDQNKLGDFFRNVRNSVVPSSSRHSPEKQQIARDVQTVEVKCNQRFPGKNGVGFFAHNGKNATITKNADGSYRITGPAECKKNSPLFDLCFHHGILQSANIQNTGQKASDTAIQSLLVDANYALSHSHLLGKKPWPNAPFA